MHDTRQTRIALITGATGAIGKAIAQAFAQAAATGVEALAFGCEITPQAVTLGTQLPFQP